MDLILKNKNAAVWPRRRGEAIACIGNEGSNVAICARNKERLDQTVSELKAKGVKAVGVIADLSSERAVSYLLKRL